LVAASSTSSSSQSHYHVKTPLPRIERSHAHPATSNIQEPIEIALKEYEGQTGINLLEHRLATELKNCDSADSVIEVLQAQPQESQKFRGHSGDVMMWVKPVVHLLHTLSTSGALGEGVSVVRWKAFHAD